MRRSRDAILRIAAAYIDYHASSKTYELTPEQAVVLADVSSSVFMPDAWQVVPSMWADEPKSRAAFKEGRGVAWGEHDERLFCGATAFYRNAYSASLVAQWLPALTDVTAKLVRGARVADIGCGHGHSTVLMAKAFPESHFWGFDVHEGSIATARQVAHEAGVEDCMTFEVAEASTRPPCRLGDPARPLHFRLLSPLPGSNWLQWARRRRTHLFGRRAAQN